MTVKSPSVYSIYSDPSLFKTLKPSHNCELSLKGIEYNIAMIKCLLKPYKEFY